MKFLIFPLIFLMSSAGAYKFISHIQTGSDEVNFINFQSQGQKLQMAYQYLKQSKSNGQTVLLLHGKNFSSSYWKEAIDYLGQKGYDVLAVDQLGFGKSSQPLSYQFSFQQLAQNTKLLIDSLHLVKVIVLGHSMGGMLATRFALMYPGSVSKLILENPIGLEDWKKSVPYSNIDQETKTELSKTRSDLKAYMTKNYFHGNWKPVYESLLDEHDKLVKDQSLQAYARNMALTSDMIFTQPVCYEFNDLSMPVVLIIGQEDRTAIGRERAGAAAQQLLGNYPLLGKKTAALIRNCRLLELNGIGHIPHIENFKVFCEQLNKALNPG